MILPLLRKMNSVINFCEFLTSVGGSKGVMIVMKCVYLSLSKVKVQKVTVVEFEMYNRSGDVL